MSTNTQPQPGTFASHRVGGYAPDATLTLHEIADLLGHNLSTIKDWNAKGQGRWPHAAQDEGGRRAWRVPVTDLLASGDLSSSQLLLVENELASRREARETRQLREQVVRLEEQLAAAVSLAEERAATIALLTNLLSSGGAA